jgi:hypothetical protein
VYLKDDTKLDEYLVDAGIGLMRLETAEGPRTGQDLHTLADHARRVRTLMRYVPKRYDPAIIEALALTGALDPELKTDQRAAAVARAAAWLQAGDSDRPGPERLARTAITSEASVARSHRLAHRRPQVPGLGRGAQAPHADSGAGRHLCRPVAAGVAQVRRRPMKAMGRRR